MTPERCRKELERWKEVTGFATPEETVAAVDKRFESELPAGLGKSLWRMERAEVAKLKEDNAKLRAALESARASIGDRLLGKGPLSKPYAQGVVREIEEALR